MSLPPGRTGGLRSWVDGRLRGAGGTTAEGPLADLLDREALRDLVLLYATAVDDHDLDTLELLFHPDAVFDRDGDLATGWPAIAETLGASMRGFQQMVHTPHAVVVDLGSPGSGVGASSGHAELVTRRGVVLAAYRYADEYARHDGRWVFGRRSVRFLYATSAIDYAETLAAVDRVRFPGETPRPSAVRPADLPGD